MESEFVSASRGVQEVLGCYHLVKELSLPIQLPILLRMDNQAAIACIMNEASSAKTKHVDIKFKFIKDLFKSKLLIPTYVTTTNMKADILTKIMPAPTFVRLRSMLGIQVPTKSDGTLRGGVLEGTVP